jgi:hypothetical protein
MKLDKILEKITPLQAKRGTIVDSKGLQLSSEELRAVVAAANVLPELVEALNQISDRYKGNHVTGNIARAALAVAENVNSESLTESKL